MDLELAEKCFGCKFNDKMLKIVNILFDPNIKLPDKMKLYNENVEEIKQTGSLALLEYESYEDFTYIAINNNIYDLLKYIITANLIEDRDVIYECIDQADYNTLTILFDNSVIPQDLFEERIYFVSQNLTKEEIKQLVVKYNFIRYIYHTKLMEFSHAEIIEHGFNLSPYTNPDHISSVYAWYDYLNYIRPIADDYKDLIEEFNDTNFIRYNLKFTWDEFCTAFDYSSNFDEELYNELCTLFTKDFTKKQFLNFKQIKKIPMLNKLINLIEHKSFSFNIHVLLNLLSKYPSCNAILSKLSFI